MAFRVNHNLGPNLEQVIDPTLVYYDQANIASPVVGDVSEGDDGHKYVWVRASAAIAAAGSGGTQITITEPAMTAAAGAGGFYAPEAGVASGSYFWARKGAL